MVRDRAGRAACHRLLERPQAPLCLGSQTAPSHPTSSRYRSNAESRIDLADAPLRQKFHLSACPNLALSNVGLRAWAMQSSRALAHASSQAEGGGEGGSVAAGTHRTQAKHQVLACGCRQLATTPPLARAKGQGDRVKELPGDETGEKIVIPTGRLAP